MRIPKEILHEDTNSIEFTIFDDKIKKTARKIIDFSVFMILDPLRREQIRIGINRKLNRVLDRESHVNEEPIDWNERFRIMKGRIR